MKKIFTIVGARPQFVKAAMVSKAITDHNREGSDKLAEVILHTGQHYDENMSRVFFDQMGIKKPKYNLEVGSGTHGASTGMMLAGIEEALIEERPDWMLVYGDTNSTLAGALAASKLQIPVCHVEAGLRSFNRRMPEEINRVLTDHVSTLLLCPTKLAVQQLKTEGITLGVHHFGDVMYDAALTFGALAENQSTIISELELKPKSYNLATVHRAENTDAKERLTNIVSLFEEIASADCPLVLPMHPRTKYAMVMHSLHFSNPHIYVTQPLSFLDMVMLEKYAKTILTDSGGVQKEAYFHGVPCVTLRDETEWVETVEAGWNQIVGVDHDRIRYALSNVKNGAPITEYGNGNSSERVVELLANI